MGTSLLHEAVTHASAMSPTGNAPIVDTLRRATLLDTAIASTNLGDQIIMEAFRQELKDVLADAMVFSVASHEHMGAKSRRLLRHSELVIAGGTNLLSSHMWLRSIWKVSPLDALMRPQVILMGVGWYQFQGKPDLYTRWFLRSVLSSTALHSVRDSYTQGMLAAIGFKNTVNTGCPTLWRFTPEHCAALPRSKAENVVTTINTYVADRAADKRLLEILRERYRTIYAWTQTDSGYDYLLSLDPALRVIRPSLAALDQLLDNPESLDYVGNRLHGGIRALQRGRRAIIVEIDNRASEMGRDFGLPTVKRWDVDRLAAMIEGALVISVTPPRAATDRWKAQVLRPAGRTHKA
jgi:polysaccharide pyruvyl transferase WcaK-like protein